MLLSPRCWPNRICARLARNRIDLRDRNVFACKLPRFRTEEREMGFRDDSSESRRRYLAAYDQSEAEKFDRWTLGLSDADHAACLADIRSCFEFKAGMSVLDAGAGTGALCLSLVQVPQIQLTALEPCPSMGALLVFQTRITEGPVGGGIL